MNIYQAIVMGVMLFCWCSLFIETATYQAPSRYVDLNAQDAMRRMIGR